MFALQQVSDAHAPINVVHQVQVDLTIVFQETYP